MVVADDEVPCSAAFPLGELSCTGTPKPGRERRCWSRPWAVEPSSSLSSKSRRATCPSTGDSRWTCPLPHGSSSMERRRGPLPDRSAESRKKRLEESTERLTERPPRGETEPREPLRLAESVEETTDRALPRNAERAPSLPLTWSSRPESKKRLPLLKDTERRDCAEPDVARRAPNTSSVSVRSSSHARIANHSINI